MMYHIDDNVLFKPFSVNYYYSKEIETAMNDIEYESIKIINKIIEASNGYKLHLELTMIELMILQCYISLSLIRSQSLRNYIDSYPIRHDSNFTCDGLIKSEEVQEMMIKKVLLHFNNLTNRYSSLLIENSNTFSKFDTNNILELKNTKYDKSIEEINNFVNSDIAVIFSSDIFIVRFDKPKLFLTATTRSSNETSKGGLVTYFPITPNIMICCY